MKMLWMSLLTLVMPSQICVLAFPLRTPKPPVNPLAGLSGADQEFAEEYLLHFYGQPKSQRKKRAADSSEDANEKLAYLKKMQDFFGLHPSGVVDNETLAVMKKPRCGLSDAEPFENTLRWKNRRLSYRITDENLPGRASKVHKVFKAAWKLWSDVTKLKISKPKKMNKTDIVISFNRRDHQDGSPFDGKGGVLAHAFSPGTGIGGDVHFDVDETWSFDFTGLSLFDVAVHEFGHALGLSHTQDPGAIMYPVYIRVPNAKFQLTYRDVKDIQHIYGVNPKYSSKKMSPPKTPHKCDHDLSFDAVTKLSGEIIFFKGRFMWRKHPQFTETRISLINSLWPDAVASNLDAVYENMENFLVFFKGRQYWKVVRPRDEEILPQDISVLGFPSRIKSVDAALHIRENQSTVFSTVFFTGHECWRYNETTEKMEEPQSIEEEWPHIPTPIDAAVFHEGYVHFFKGNRHYHYDHKFKKVMSVTYTRDFLECQRDNYNETYAKKR